MFSLAAGLMITMACSVLSHNGLQQEVGPSWSSTSRCPKAGLLLDCCSWPFSYLWLYYAYSDGEELGS